MHPPILLASASIYKNDLLKKLQIDFESIAPDIDESALLNESPKALSERLAKEKALIISHSEEHKNKYVIASDQVASADSVIFSKPLSIEKATEQLHFLSEKKMSLFTSVAIAFKGEIIHQHLDQSNLYFKRLTEEYIDFYLKKEPEAIYSAGSLQIESLGISLLNRVESQDFTAIIGLPLLFISHFLDEYYFNNR